MATSDTDAWIHGIFSYILMAGFNNHVPHHFFPTADHHMLPKIKKIMEEVCRERGLKYNDKTRWECAKSLTRGFTKRVAFANK